MSRVLVTGGAGYIGSHTVKKLAAAGHEIATYDNLSRGFRDAVRWGRFVEGALADTDLLRATIAEFQPDAVIHFAAFAYVGESVENPSLYYENNIGGTLSLLKAMRDYGCGAIVVSSTCATYGQPDTMPIVETTPQRPINPYGYSKLVMEQMCHDFDRAHGIQSVALRYFNAAGCDPEGEIGERHDPEPHLIPRALMAAAGEIDALEIFGNDYDTPDGTCIRDYIHVNDLADGHLRAVDYLLSGGGSEVFNLGTGVGSSVKEILAAVAAASGSPVPHRFAPRRAGDPAVLVADPFKANTVLGWRATSSDLATIASTAWAWHRRAKA
jgi:UDP-arabinose 4-epimerase